MPNKTTIITLVALGGITYYLYLRGGQSQNTMDNSERTLDPNYPPRHYTEQEKNDYLIKHNLQ